MGTIKTKLPKRKEINPQDHEITLSATWPDEDDLSNVQVDFKFGGTEGSLLLIKSEAAQIGKWFTDVSKALK